MKPLLLEKLLNVLKQEQGNQIFNYTVPDLWNCFDYNPDKIIKLDTNELMVSFTTSNQSSEPAFQEVMKCKMEAEKEKAAIEKYCFLMFLFEKKASNAITNKEFELFKNT